MRYFVLNILLLFALSATAQDIKRTAVWYFGQNAGIDFNTNPPTPLTNSAMNTVEGCATICDTNGKLLFYTNGEKIWNKNHQIMDNGNGLLGHVSSTQSSIIIPQPDNDSLFYVFTTAAVGQAAGLQYNIVNINTNSGLGKVTTKNIPLQTPVCEKLTATHHENGKDIWILAHGFANIKFYSYLITDKGLINCPIISEIGSSHGDFANITDAQGAMKFSPDGKLLAVTVFGKNKVELFDFNKHTGQINNLRTELTGIFLAYSLEFSPEQEYLYIGDKGKNVYQYFLNTFPPQINNTKKVVYTHSSDAVQGLQMGLDKKIYQAVIQASFTARINRPDSLGDSSLYTYNGFNLGGKRSEYDLPNFITSYFYIPKIDFIYQTNCLNNNIQFTEKSTVPVSIRKWSIFKGNAFVDSSALSNPTFIFSDTGVYKIQLIINSTDTVTKEVMIEPELISVKDTTLCNQLNYTVVIPDNYRCIMWKGGNDTNRYTVSQSGTYVVSAYNTKGCYVTDSIKITFKTIGKPNIRKSNDTLYTDSIAANYQWYFNSTAIDSSNSSYLKITQNGIYKLTTTDSSGCSNTSDNFGVSGLGFRDIEQLPFSIYPNPATGIFYLKTNLANYSIIVTNVLGQTVYQLSHATRNTEIEIATGGIYFIQVQDYLGNTFTQKLLTTQ